MLRSVRPRTQRYRASQCARFKHAPFNLRKRRTSSINACSSLFLEHPLISSLLFALLVCVRVGSRLVDEGSVVSALLQSGLVMDGGVVTTLNNNTQQWDFPNAWAPLQWMLVQGLASARYDSASTMDTFNIYNSSADAPGTSHPPSECDIVRPDTWFNCTNTGGALSGCRWCFPPGPDISKAIGQRWVLGNYIYFNRTGLMLEKYYAPVLGGAGAGGEYALQIGFGWTNGVALDLLVRYGEDAGFSPEALLRKPYLFDKMAAFVDVSPLVPHEPLPVEPRVATLSKEAAHYGHQIDRAVETHERTR